MKVKLTREIDMPTKSKLSFQLLEEFVRSCLFIHDDVLQELITEIGQLNWDQFSTNPFFLGAKVCVVDTLDGFGQEYLTYLRSLNCLPETIIIPKYHVPSLLENLLMDKTALQQLKAVSQERRLNISSFYSDTDKDFDALVAHLSEGDYIPGLYPAKGIFKLANDKLFMRACMIKAGVPIPEGEVCNSKAELRQICSYNRKRGYLTLIKRLHWQTKVIADESELEDEVDAFDFPSIVERAYDRIVSPVSHYISYRSRIEHLFSISQIIENWRHYGNELPLKLTEEVRSRIHEYSYAIIQQIPEYEGLLGIDYILTPQNNVLAVDLNPRFNSSTYPFYFLQRVGADLGKVYARFRFARIAIENLSSIYTDKSFIPFNPQRLDGILLMSPVFDFISRKVIRFLYLVVARNEEGLKKQEETLYTLLEKHRYTR